MAHEEEEITVISPVLRLLQFPWRRESQPTVVQFMSVVEKYPLFIAAIVNSNINPIKSDIARNVAKMQKTLDTCPPSEAELLRDYVVREDVPDFCDGLLRLKRMMDFSLALLLRLLDDFRHGETAENLRTVYLQVYADTMEKFHNFQLRQAVKALLSVGPSRTAILTNLAGGVESVPVVYSDIESVVRHSEAFVEQIDNLVIDCGVVEHPQSPSLFSFFE